MIPTSGTRKTAGRSSWLLVAMIAIPSSASAQPNAAAIIRDSIDHWRGESSIGTMTMSIHRPDWERSLSMRSWTRGEKESLVRVSAPPRDAGNGTLMLDNNMWTYSPKVNRVIKVPSSMMSQSWMGSDFSNKDVSRSDDIVDQYEHTLLETVSDSDHQIHVIESVPHEYAAVVWGREVLRIRDDHVLLRHSFFDQDGELVKTLETLEVSEMGGRAIATRQRMMKVDRADEWTEITIEAIEFDVDLADNLFTLANLRNPRE